MAKSDDTYEARRGAAVDYRGAANDLALQVTATIEISRGLYDEERDVDVTGDVTLGDEPMVVVHQAAELGDRELATAWDALLDKAEAMERNRREGERLVGELRAAVGL